MLIDYKLPARNTDPRSLLVINHEAILRRVESGMKVTAIHKELMAFLEAVKSDASCSIQTLRRYIKNSKRSRELGVVASQSRPRTSIISTNKQIRSDEIL